MRSGWKTTSFRWRSACNRRWYMWELLVQVKHFMTVASAFLGNHHVLAKAKVDR
ncbi:hypothetical protein PRK99_02050 [Pectobacterium polonicum]|uniref:hypothetical protein n=1 Tax=Pectobacterium polonicum TaxID=2485124 RepID=UPI000AB889AF|nr:hypothetical protein [Pectobacterium polonicum]MDC9818155.1 hypothetical protein [Pectobacterium polonicum]